MVEWLQPARFRVEALARVHSRYDAPRLDSPDRHVAFVAALLEGLADWGETTPISRNLSDGAQALARSLEALPLSLRSELAKRVDHAALAELASLSTERDPLLFVDGMLGLAGRLEARADPSLAAVLVLSLRRRIEQSSEWRAEISPELWARLNRECEIAEGRGPLATRVESLLRHFAREVSHPATLASFAAGAGAFQSLRLWSLARLTAAPTSFLTSAWRARSLASLAGLGGETLALTMTNRSLREALGERQAWDFVSLRRELLANGITLGLMRGAGSLSEFSFRSLHGITPGATQATRFAGFSRVSRAMIPQTAMFGGLLLAHRAETALGLRPEVDASTMLVDSLATLLHFNVGARIFEAVQPRGFRAWTQGLEAQSRLLASGPPRGGGPTLGSWVSEPPFAWAEASRAPGELIRPHEGMWAMSEMPKKHLGLPTTESPRPESVIAPSPVRYREVLEASPHPVFVVDAQGELRYGNALALRIFRPTLLDFSNIRILEVFEPHPSEPGLYVWSRAGHELSYWRMESRNLGGEEGLIAYFLSDVTELQTLKQQAAALREQNVRLDAKSQITDRFAHDVGNLFSDLSFREGVLERSIGSEGASGEGSRWSAFTQRAKELGSSLNSVIAYFRSWRRITSGGPRQISVLSMEPLVNEALRLNESARLRNGIRLETDFGSEALTVRGEEALLVNAVLNLMANACHAMPDGGTLRVRTYPRDAFVVIEVTDTGVGISPEHLSRIFDAGFTTRSRSGGTGLGLANVKTAVEEVHGGRVELDSRVGAGTTFRLLLPSSAR